MEQKLNKFEFKLMQVRDSEDYPFSPFGHIYLSQYTKSNHEDIILTSQLMTAEEIDYNVDALIKSLEQVRIAAKKKLASSHAK